MGAAEIQPTNRIILIQSHIISYGNAASSELTEQIRNEIETMWNEAHGRIVLKNESFLVQFRITAETKPGLSELDVLQNVNPCNNYFRIEEFAHSRISFVDGLGCNSGYFLLENLYKGSTTAAHEYGHTLGLDHPRTLDIRGRGVPGIMYPRGTLVDPEYQYDPSIPAGQKGGTMHPMYRRVKQEDIQNLRLHKLDFENGKATLGQFTNIYHWNHAEGGPEDFFIPPIFG
ncbi:MAG TPA: peptidase M10 [Flavisolibacter sp.]|nr:peptidase M10 [Flavisolibacter sp.]